MLGGSSGANYMFYIRGNKIDYDEWVEQGNDGWESETVMDYFMKSERLNDNVIMGSSYAHFHNTNGYLGVTRPPWRKSAEKYLNAFKQNGHNILLDYNGQDQMGYVVPAYTVDDGVRQHTSKAFLEPIKDRKNLHVLTNSYTRKILFNKYSEAIGVVVRLNNKKIVNIFARKELILSAGAINSPQLLMLSGVRPRKNLEEVGIQPLLDLPMVGSNLQDHSIVIVALGVEKDKSSITDNFDLVVNLDKFPTPCMMGHVSLNKSNSRPEYQTSVFPLPVYSPVSALMCSYVFRFTEQICEALHDANKQRRILLTILTLLRPESKGNISSRSNNPEVAPIIYNGYYSNKADIENHAKFVEEFVRVVNTSYIRSVDAEVDLKIPQCKSHVFGSHEYWKCHVLNIATTQWHPAGTCGMGRDVHGVVDERLRVHGVSRLRVVDASIMPTIISGNLNAPVIMIAEKASDMIKVDHGIQYL